MKKVEENLPAFSGNCICSYLSIISKAFHTSSAWPSLSSTSTKLLLPDFVILKVIGTSCQDGRVGNYGTHLLP